MKDFVKNKYVIFVFQCFMVAFGAFIMGFAFRTFFIPTGITPSGFSGLAKIISDLLAKINILLSPSIIFIIINIGCFILAILMFGLKFSILSTVGILSYSLFMDVAYVESVATIIESEYLLTAIIGGAIMGIGYGITFRFGGSTGGSDIVAMALNKKVPKIKTGQCQFCINMVVLLLSIVCYGLDLAFYVLIAMFISGQITDIMLNGIKTVRAVYIICSREEEISKKIMTTFGQGVTKIDATGMFSHQEKSVLLALVATHQAPFVKNIVMQIEPNAIVFSTSVTEAMGEKAFLKVKEKEKISSLATTIKTKIKLKRKDFDQIKDIKKLKKKTFHLQGEKPKPAIIDFDTFVSEADEAKIAEHEKELNKK